MDAAPLWTDHERHATSMMNADVFSSTRFQVQLKPNHGPYVPCPVTNCLCAVNPCNVVPSNLYLATASVTTGLGWGSDWDCWGGRLCLFM